jgi:hypothetical protein
MPVPRLLTFNPVARDELLVTEKLPAVALPAEAVRAVPVPFVVAISALAVAEELLISKRPALPPPVDVALSAALLV